MSIYLYCLIMFIGIISNIYNALIKEIMLPTLFYLPTEVVEDNLVILCENSRITEWSKLKLNVKWAYYTFGL